MVRSMVVILALVLLVVFLVPRPSSVTQPPVDVTSAATAARSQLGFVPAAVVPSGWTATSTRVVRDASGTLVWNVNYLTPQGRYAGLDQVAAWSQDWQDRVTGGAPDQGPVTVGGRTWTRFQAEGSDQIVLVQREAGRAAAVTVRKGSVDNARTLAAALPAA